MSQGVVGCGTESRQNRMMAAVTDGVVLTAQSSGKERALDLGGRTDLANAPSANLHLPSVCLTGFQSIRRTLQLAE